jgi:hypothetical protein
MFDGGHLIAMTHAKECVDIIAHERAGQMPPGR